VNPIEEVTVSVEAEDDFALRGMDLHYSVNGGPEKTVALGGKSGKKAAGSATLYLEDHKLVPGDIVSFYATARDAQATSRSDIFFIEAQPFEREYSQSQQMGGGGGGEMPQVAAHQKEIIAATWNQVKNPQKDEAAEKENARMLADIQSKLREQAQSMGGRMSSREMTGVNPAFKSFAEDMGQAVQAMEQAEAKLRAREWQGALPPEEKSLQYLSRAEATFRQIQVAFSNRGGGQGGAGRDLEGMFDLELDREKNQFETGRNASSPDQRQKQLEEALSKLEELARRQQELAEQRRQNQQAYQQRWQQEMLRREAEELQRKMEQLARSQAAAGRQGQPGEESGDSQVSQQGGGQSAAMSRALERLAEAMRDMQNAGSAQNQGSPQGEAEARRAAERLREAGEMLAGERKQQAAGQMSDLARRAQELADKQRDFENTLRQAFGYAGLDEQGRPTLQPGTSRRRSPELMEGEKSLIEKLTRLEQDMQRVARDIAGTQPLASQKLRDALAEVQKQDIGMKMGWSAEVMRQGYGPYALTRQPAVTQGLKQLRDRVQEAQSALNQGQRGANDVDSALARVERLREQLEQMKNAAQGQLPGRTQGGKKGQAARGQPGQGPETAESASGSGTSPGGSTSGTVNSGGQAGVGPWARGGPGIDRAHAEHALGDGIRDLAQLEQFLRGNREIPRQVARDVQDLMRQIQQFDSRGLGAQPERLEQVIDQLLSGVDGVELQLRRLSDQQQAGSVRSGASQPLAPGYADAVAEYFKRLASQK
jgi:hypothetical protein